jgi:hypothetical protein
MGGFRILPKKVQKTRLIQQLKSLTLKENSQLERYLRSPFFNNNQHILNLYEYLNNFHPEFKDESLTKKAMFSHAFPGEPYEAKRLSTLTWQFCVTIEDFFVALELKQSPDKRGILLKNSYRRRELQSDYETQLFKLNKHYNESKDVSFRSNLGRLEVLNELLFQLARNEYDNFENTMFPIHDFEDALQFVRVHGEINLYRLVNSLKRLNFDLELKYKNKYLSPHNISFNKEIISSHILLDINDTANKLYGTFLKKEDLEEYRRITNLYIQNISYFSEPEQLKLYIILQNIRGKFIEEKMIARKIAFNLTKVALVNDVLGRNSSFNYVTFTSIAMLGGVVGEFDYTHDFIKKYHILLDIRVREDIKNYSLAYLAFFEGKYEDVDFLIAQIKFTNISALKLNAKSLVIRSYYELLERDGRVWLSLLRSNLRSFDKYLNRTKGIRLRLKQANLNFLAITKRLTARRININKTKEQQEELKSLLSTSTPIILDLWLKEKIDNLLKRKVGQKKESSTR